MVIPVLVAAATFVGGLVLGGFGPRAEVRELKDRVFELEREMSRDGSGAGRELARLLTKGLDDVGSDAPPSSPTGEDAALAGDLPSESRLPEAEHTVPLPRRHTPRDPPTRDAPTSSGPEPLEAARDALEIRTVQARAALVEDIAPTRDQLHRIDVAVADMNDELVVIAQDLVARVRTEGEPSRRDLMVVGADVLDTLVAAEDRMLEAMTPEQRDVVREESTDPTSFVDPAVIEILMTLEGLEP